MLSISLLLGAQFQQPLPLQELLASYAKQEKASLCVDVGSLSVSRPFAVRGPSATEGLDRLAAFLDRTWSLVEGTYVLSRVMEGGDLRGSTPVEHVRRTLRSLGVIDLESLRKGTLSMASLSQQQQSTLRFVIARSGDGLGDSMLADYPHQIGVRLLFDAKLSCESRTNDGHVAMEVLHDKSSVPYPRDVPPTLVTEPLGGPADGEMDFGDGRIMDLQGIADLALIRFGTRLEFDPRLSRSVYFLSGKFTQRRLLSVLMKVTEPTPLSMNDETARETPDPRQLIETVFGPHRDEKIGIGDLTIGDALDARKMSFQDAFGDRPPQRVRAFMYQYRLEPKDEFTLSCGASLGFSSPGVATLYGGLASNGRQASYTVPHFFKVLL